MNVNELRQQFPQLAETVYGKPLVYLDNAATSLRPLSVVEKWTEMSLRLNSNIHRAVHHTSEAATAEYENAREAVGRFIGASSRDEIIFTSGATESLNLAAGSFCEAFLKPGDEIIVCEAEHHSDLVPWQQQCRKKGAVMRRLPVSDEGYVDLDALKGLLGPRTILVCVCHISNVLGIVNPVKEIAALCHSAGCRLLVDGSQAVAHLRVDVKELDCDFYAFSGHKMFAATGTGVLYGRKELLDRMPPFLMGGEMIDSVKWDSTDFAPVPRRFEAGTRNFASVPTLVPAIAAVEAMRAPEIQRAQEEIRDYMLDALGSDRRITLFGRPERREDKIPLFSFCVEGAHHEDLALIMDKMGFALRSGQMCAEPLMDRFGVTGMLRASFAPYNTLEEAQRFIESLGRAVEMLV
ncbi:MAG: aminotransferase class V-fold PLP-dependent enzyme [Bacteroidales bacterium]|nr:aminotransferase class V-fold PLP-dependent enzyme [Bacteroidales bacterium]